MELPLRETDVVETTPKEKNNLGVITRRAYSCAVDFGRCYRDGFVTLGVSLNLGNHEGGVGDRVIDRIWRRNCGGSVENPLAYRLGMLSELALEIAVPVSVIAYSDVPWYAVLGADALVKINAVRKNGW